MKIGLCRIGIALAAGFFALASSAQAVTTYQLLVQTRVDSSAPNEVYLASFPTLDDVFAQNIGSPTGFTDIEVQSGYEISAMTWDGSAFRLLVSSRADSTAPNEVYLASFATLDDLFTQTIGSPSDFTDIEIQSDYQVAGLTWDGAAYRLLVETRDDSAAPYEVYLASFATLDDLFAQTIGTPTDFTDIEVQSGYRIADLTWDGTAYRVLVETEVDAAAPNEVYLASFATLDDLFNQTIGSPSDFTDLEIQSDYRIAGFSSVTSIRPPPSVPEPSAWSLLIIGFGATGMLMRRRRPVTAAA